jgi:hypothetical protein
VDDYADEWWRELLLTSVAIPCFTFSTETRLSFRRCTGLQHTGARLVASLGVAMMVHGFMVPNRSRGPHGASTCSRLGFSPDSSLTVDGPVVAGASMSLTGAVIPAGRRLFTLD